MYSGFHLPLNIEFSILDGCLICPTLTYRPCIDVSRPLSIMPFMRRGVGASPLKTINKSEFKTFRPLKKTQRTRILIFLLVSPPSAIERMVVGFVDFKELKFHTTHDTLIC